MDKLQIKVSNIIKNNMLYSFKVNKRTKVINLYIKDNFLFKISRIYLKIDILHKICKYNIIFFKLSSILLAIPAIISCNSASNLLSELPSAKTKFKAGSVKALVYDCENMYSDPINDN